MNGKMKEKKRMRRDGGQGDAEDDPHMKVGERAFRI